MSSEIYHIGFGVNDKYVKYAGVLMTNIVLKHLGQPIYFHIACDGIYDIDRKRLTYFTNLYRNVKVFIYDCRERLDRLNSISKNTAPNLHRAVLLRLLLPVVVPKEVKRLLYMDVDILCVERLDSLWKLDMKNFSVAGLLHSRHKMKAKEWNLTQDKFLCGGFLYINVPLWNERNITERALENYQKYSEKMRAIEEDALNCVLDGDFLEISNKFCYRVLPNNPLNIKLEEGIITMHFEEETKPWTNGCLPEFKKMYWNYVEQSLWNDITSVEPVTVKSAFLAGTTAELEKDYKGATKYYRAVAIRLIEYFLEKNRETIFNEEIKIL